MRHTACTRMAECRMDVKVLQYIMGHANIDVTMEVYNHIGELTRIENEIARLDSMVLNALHHKKKNWCQIGVIKCTLCQGHYDFSFSDFYFIFVCCVEASK